MPMKAPASPLTPPVRPMLFLPFSFTFKRNVDRAVLRVLLDFRILLRLQLVEILQLIQAQQRQLPQVAVIDLAFFQRQFAADHFVARRGVALELDAADVELLALVKIDFQADRASSRRRRRYSGRA